jgi:RNA polymerase sigma factor (sigma-70 family)
MTSPPPLSGLRGAERPIGMEAFERAIAQASRPLRSRLVTFVGDVELADDLLQEARIRAWSGAPRELAFEQLQAWLYRTATRLAIDEHRRRRRRAEVPFDDARTGLEDASAAELRHTVAGGLDALAARDRIALLLRYEGGLSHAELGSALGISAEAARKRVARAATTFRQALAADERVAGPSIAVLLGDDDPDAYRRWLEAAGARMRIVDLRRPGLDLAGADALVLSGSAVDIDPRTYGARRDHRTIRPDLSRDLRDLAALRLALRENIPVLGVCRGAQLLNIAFGGDLAQHIEFHAGARLHVVDTRPESRLRRVLGRRGDVHSDHHQAIGRLAAGLRVGSVAPDGVIEAVEVPEHRFALGLQWHPEREAGETLADALCAAAAA